MQTEQRIKELALELNLPLCGITSPQLDTLHYEKFRKWLESGALANMEYLGRDPQRRRSVLEIMPEARSVIVFGLPYSTGCNSPDSAELAGRISRYATGRDYHHILEKKLKEIIRRTPELASARNRIYVDYGPLLERAYAQAAGLGFIGKNNCLINPVWGSFIFLAEIVTELALEHDEACTHNCGDCRACLDACPAGALSEAYVLDARHCISFHSVENKTAVPPEVREKWSDNWIIGCDTCQNACPYNRNIPVTPEPECSGIFQSRHTELEKFLLCDEEAFNARFAGSPLRRAGYSAMARNCAIVAAHSPNKEAALELLEKALLLHRNNEMLKEHILWAIRRIGDKQTA